jgi:hypothetical protein
MQETCKLQRAFNQNSETFNINFSDFTKGCTNPNILVYNFELQLLPHTNIQWF